MTKQPSPIKRLRRTNADTRTLQAAVTMAAKASEREYLLGIAETMTKGGP
ncbi:MAG: hypothetical protein M3453_03390 [Pseudomonadota bacterium]|nr:hypothetical protein [Pseudomonadota bacterium]